MSSMRSKPYLLALHSIDGLGPIRLRAVLDYFKDPKIAWEAPGQELIKIGIPKNTVDLFLETRKKLEPESYVESIHKSGIKWITFFDENYPKLLSQIYDPPIVLYYKGEVDWDRKSIAVVGSRKITDYGKVVTEQFTKGLVSAGLTIVSGLARGVDSQAHQTTLDSGGQTIAVLGGGLNNIFPPENRRLAEKIAAGFGAVISEFPPDYPALPGNFPVRNRIISGLSLATLVIEAAQDSGSLITARLALEQGRDVFTVGADFIKDWAITVYVPEEILEELGINSRVQGEAQLSEEEKKVLRVLENENMHIEEIGRQLNFPSAKISALLLKMEISGLVQSVGSGIYCRKQ